MNLILDIGNTRCKVALFDQGRLLEVICTREIPVSWLSSLSGKKTGIEKVMIASVREPDEKIWACCQKHFSTCIILDHTTPLPIVNRYKSPETLGYDRIAGVVAAHQLHPGSASLVIDAGTAITYDVLNENQEYLGGNISPGLHMRYQVLHEKTQKLPLEGRSEKDSLYGNDTSTALIHGVQNGVVFEIERYIREFKRLNKKNNVFLTGGDAFFLGKKLKSRIFVFPNMVLFGLNRILEYNVNK